MLSFIKKHKILSVVIGVFYILLILSLVVPIRKYELIMPGDISSISSDITINDRTDNNEFYSVYVSVYNYPTLFQLLYSKLSKNITVVNISNNLYSPKQMNVIDELREDMSFKNALILAYTKANEIDSSITIDYEIESYFITISREEKLKPLTTFTHINDISVKELDYTALIGEILESTNPVFKVNGEDIVVEKEKYRYLDFVAEPVFKINNASPDYNTFYEGDNKTGSSGGLVQALKIYATLLNKKYNKVVAGTGTITYSGLVGPIGGINQKVYAVHKKVDIFFVPENNYDDALKSYNMLKRPKFKLVKVSSFDEALEELEK